jgi:hypothetical protein
MDDGSVATFLFSFFTKLSKISVQKELFLPNISDVDSSLKT